MQANSSGYTEDPTIDLAFESTLKLANGDLHHEKDSVLHNNFPYPWPVLTSLLYIGYTNKSQLRVLDFGGAFGINYFQNRKFLQDSLSLYWQILEQEKVVEKGKLHFETGDLRFIKEEPGISELQEVNCLIFSGVLQYFENPYNVLESWIAKGIPFILIDKTTFIKAPVQRLTLHTIPGNNSKISFPCWLFNTSEFLKKFADQYELIADFPRHDHQRSFLDDGTPYEWKGFLFQLRK